LFALDAQRRALAACYQELVQREPERPVQGIGSVSFAIDEDGLVMPGRSSAQGAAVPLRPCLERVLGRLRFPRPEIGPVMVTLQLNLVPLP
jgi:hypothetical protein